MIEIKPFPAFRDNYIWLIEHTRNRSVAIVDPGDATVVINAIHKYQLTPVAILITHRHHDHVGGILELIKNFHIPVYGPARESIPGMTHPLHDQDFINLPDLDLNLQIFDVPGHTSGHIAYYTEGILFIGDTIFMAGCGRLFDGTAEQLYHSIDRVAKLPNSTLLYCTHEYTLTNLQFAQAVEPENKDISARIQQCLLLRENNIPTVPNTLLCEKTTNPFLRTHVDTVIAAVENFAGHRLNTTVDVFTQLRKWKDIF